jgi:hypothetical protein
MKDRTAGWVLAYRIRRAGLRSSRSPNSDIDWRRVRSCSLNRSWPACITSICSQRHRRARNRLSEDLRWMRDANNCGAQRSDTSAPRSTTRWRSPNRPRSNLATPVVTARVDARRPTPETQPRYPNFDKAAVPDRRNSPLVDMIASVDPAVVDGRGRSEIRVDLAARRVILQPTS